VSSLVIEKDPWGAYPSPDTTVLQLELALEAFPHLDVAVTLDQDVLLIVVDDLDPPTTPELALALYGDDDELIVSELFDQEARDRHAEGV
jgi:hypothetical protein